MDTLGEIHHFLEAVVASVELFMLQVRLIVLEEDINNEFDEVEDSLESQSPPAPNPDRRI